MNQLIVLINRSVTGATWTDREGRIADRSEFFTGTNPGTDSMKTLSFAGLVVFTDATVVTHPESSTLAFDFK